MTTIEQNHPPSNTRWIIGSHDLPQSYGAARFRITKSDGSTFDTVISKRKRQTLEAIMRSPVYCASPIRLSDNVGILRHEHGIAIETKFYDDDTGPVPTRYGVYTLSDQVTYLGEVARKAVAA